MQLKQNKQSNAYLTGNGKIEGYTQFKCILLPLENHTIGFNWDQVNTSGNTKYNNAFYDVSYQFMG
jgi:hypothetical protein